VLAQTRDRASDWPGLASDCPRETEKTEKTEKHAHPS